MIWANLLAFLALFFSFIGGLKEGAIKNFFFLIILMIAIPITGATYRLFAVVFSFLPGEKWDNFVGFLVTLAMVSIALHFAFLVPKKSIKAAHREGCLSRIIGGALSLFNAAIGIVLFSLLVLTYPVMEWLERAIVDSSILTWLTANLSFVQALLPEIFHRPLHQPGYPKASLSWLLPPRCTRHSSLPSCHLLRLKYITKLKMSRRQSRLEPVYTALYAL